MSLNAVIKNSTIAQPKESSVNQSVKKLFIKTHGCQMNVYDSARMADMLAASDYKTELVTEEAEADIILLNTCSIREKAQEKVFHQLGRWKKLKRTKPDLIIGVGGCVASQEGIAIQKRAPHVDMVFGPQTIHRIPDMLHAVQSNTSSVTNPSVSSSSLAFTDATINSASDNTAGSSVHASASGSTPRQAYQKDHKLALVDISFPEIEKFDRLPEPRAEGPEAFVSVMEGCSRYCSFCVVPYTRGTEISRPFTSIMEEIRQLADQGVREINLLGQNVNAYRGLSTTQEQMDLAELIYHVAHVDGIDRIRYTTSHPLEFSDALIAVYAEVPELVNHLHLPVQSGSNRILKRMKRGYTQEYYRDRIARLRKIRPNISISSDFIVGFPDETEADFAATMDLIADTGFDTSFSFIYSKRPGTPAAELADSVPLAVKQERLSVLQHAIHHQATQISKQMVSGIHKVLVHDFSKRNMLQLQGRTENNRIVHFTSDDPDLIGQFVPIKITQAMPNSMLGTLFPPTESI